MTRKCRQCGWSMPMQAQSCRICKSAVYAKIALHGGAQVADRRLGDQRTFLKELFSGIMGPLFFSLVSALLYVAIQWKQI